MTTTYFLNCVMGNVFKTKTTPTIPNRVYLGLSSTEPNMDGSGATEPSVAAAYARVPLTTLSVPTNGVITNTDDITFPESTNNWGTMTHFVLYDSATGGNLLMYNELTQPRSIESATIVMVKPDNLKLTLTNPT